MTMVLFQKEADAEKKHGHSRSQCKPLFDAFEQGWRSCQQKMIAGYRQAQRDGCDANGAWKCALEAADPIGGFAANAQNEAQPC